MQLFNCYSLLALILALLLTAEGANAAWSAVRRSDRDNAGDGKAPAAAAAPLTAGTFSRQMLLDGQAGAVLSFTLPESVYKELQLPEFQDLCLFDAEGAPVPFQLGAPEKISQRLEVEKELPYFIWQPEKPEAVTPGAMDVEIDTGGGIVRVKSRTEGAGEPARPDSISCLLDLQAFFAAIAETVAGERQAFSAFDLQERAIEVILKGSEPLMVSVTMETSADLESWTAVGQPQMLVRMQQGEAALKRNTLFLPGTARRYLLLRFSGSDIPVSSLSARAVFSKTTPDIRETIIPGALAEDKRAVSYTLPGRFPVIAVGFDLPQADILAVRLLGADDPGHRYYEYARGFIYRLEKNGVTVTGEAFPLSDSCRYWKLEAMGDIPFTAAPEMRVRWQPRDILFLARGKGPWTLAFGRQTAVQPSAWPMLAQSDARPAREIALLPAAEPAAEPATGSAAAPPPAAAEKDQGWVLWAVLVLAAVFLAGVTLWLVRSMRKKS